MTDERDDDEVEHSEKTDVRNMRTLVEGVAELRAGQAVLHQVTRSEERILGAMRDLRGDLKAIERSLHGEWDGKTGLVARVTALETGAAERTAALTLAAAQQLETQRGRNAWIAAGIAAAAAVVVALFAFLTHG